jgi:PRTRC genetic system ThiF family protein
MPGVHRLPPELLSRAVTVTLVGCGGTGSVFAGWLPYLHKTLVALGHPAGLQVTIIDGDTVSESNCVRQMFSAGDVGRNKADVIVERTNLFFGQGWKANRRYLRDGDALRSDLVIGCVDTRAARKLVARACVAGGALYWLDCGNNDYDGQFVLGQPRRVSQTYRNGRMFEVPAVPEDVRLRTVAELYPATIDDTLPDDAPACSAVEALTRQGAFVNQAIASHAAVMLARLFRFGEISHHGEFINFVTGRAVPIPVLAGAGAATPTKRSPARRRRAAAIAG